MINDDMMAGGQWQQANHWQAQAGRRAARHAAGGAYEIGEYTLNHCEKKAEALSHCQLAALRLLQTKCGAGSGGVVY
jgi:hypothetical protein